MGERDPRKEPKPGDVFRFKDGSEYRVVAVEVVMAVTKGKSRRFYGYAREPYHRVEDVVCNAEIIRRGDEP